MFDNPINPGQRQVDNRSDSLTYNGTGGDNVTAIFMFGKAVTVGPSDLIDTQGFVSYSLYVSPQAAIGCTPSAGVLYPTANIYVAWWNDDVVAANKVRSVATTVLETSGGVTPIAGTPLYVRGKCLARYMQVGINWNANVITSTQVEGVLQLSSVDIPSLELPDADGILLDFDYGSVPAGTSSFSAIVPAYSGAMRIGINGQSTGTANAQGRIRGGFGAVQAVGNRVVLLTPPALPVLFGQTTFFDFPVVPNRCFCFQFANVGTVAGVFNVQVYGLGV